jgi:hypothetical protein
MTENERIPVRVRLTTEDIFDDGEFTTRRYSINVLINGTRDYDIDLASVEEIEQLAKLLTEFAAKEKGRQD